MFLQFETMLRYFYLRNLSHKFRKLERFLRCKKSSTRIFIQFRKAVDRTFPPSLFLSFCFIASRPCFRHVETKLAGFVLEARSSDTGKINYCPPPRAPLRSPWKRSFFEDTRVENPIFRTRPAVPIRGSMGRLKLRII